MNRLAAEYRRFSIEDTPGRSALYTEITREVADDRELLAILSELEPAKRQPNLLLAAVRHLYADFARDWAQFRERFLARRDEALELIRTHRTQTNEPARCALLLPVLASLPQPLALLEVGTSAGLCLLPDRYGYDYGQGRRLAAPARDGDGGGPVFRCDVNTATPIPTELPEVVWRAGLDLAPIDVTDDESVSWLESLVWPGEGERLALLREAVQVARADPPRIVRGDLRHDLPALAEQAPAGATLVVFHTAVLGYVHDAGDRRRFAETVRAVGARWIADEPPGVVELEQPPRLGPAPGGEILLSLDSEPLAWADPHGAWLRWLA
ncbi:MAG TPA: DUF2332 domain-containing protein [Solirubrobacteraceae bacterium]|jgi:hypothetical protein|nr:DUF2332 domain-containing protein [Solirubrobacteraceae bacterium]